MNLEDHELNTAINDIAAAADTWAAAERQRLRDGKAAAARAEAAKHGKFDVTALDIEASLKRLGLDLPPGARAVGISDRFQSVGLSPDLWNDVAELENAALGMRRLANQAYWGPESDYDADALRPPTRTQRSHFAKARGQLPAEVRVLCDRTILLEWRRDQLRDQNKRADEEWKVWNAQQEIEARSPELSRESQEWEAFLAHEEEQRQQRFRNFKISRAGKRGEVRVPTEDERMGGQLAQPVN